MVQLLEWLSLIVLTAKMVLTVVTLILVVTVKMVASFVTVQRVMTVMTDAVAI